jgi:signal transduction histidine kinase
MMQKIYLLFFLLWIQLISFTQTNKELDSLLKSLDTEKEDSTLQKNLFAISGFYTDNNPTKAIGYLDRAVELAQKLNRQLPLASAYYRLGFCYLLKSDYDKSLDNYLKSTKIYEFLKDERRLANAYLSIGNVFFQNKAFSKATDYYNQAESLAIKNKDSIQIGDVLGQRSFIYDQIGKYDSAILYQQKAIAIYRMMGDEVLLYNGLSNLGLNYKHKKNTTLALQYLDSSLSFYIKDVNAPKDILSGTYNNIAATHAQAGNYEAALQGFNKSLELAIEGNLPSIEMENYRNMADMFYDKKDFPNHSLYLKKYYNLKDSMFNTANKNQLTELEADYQLEKKNASLAKQEAETQKSKNQRNIFMVISIAILGLLTALAFLYHKIKKNNALLLEKNAQIQLQKEELQSLNTVKDRLFSIISHDLRNPLVALKSYLSLADQPNLTAEKKDTYKKQTVQAVAHTSNMLDNLLVWANLQLKNTKPSITNIDLEDCVNDAIGTCKAQALQKNIQFNKIVLATTALGESTILEIALRNILSNAVKFSPTNSDIIITTKRENTATFITIKDSGVGMTAAQINGLLNNETETTVGTDGEKGTGLGFFLVKELLQKINGMVTIESAVGKGTTITIQLPH